MSIEKEIAAEMEKLSSVESIQEEVNSAVEETEEEINPTKELAKSKGWRDNRAEIESKGIRFKDYEEFLAHEELIEKVKATAEDNKKLQMAVRELITKSTERENKAYERARIELEQERLRAVNDGDTTRFQQIDQEIKQLDRELPKSDQDSLHLEADKFKERNKDWFNAKTKENYTMKQYAIALDEELMREYPNMSHADRYAEIEKTVKREFAPKPKSDNLNKVAGNEQRQESTSSKTKLTEHQESLYQICRKSVPGYTRDQYMKDMNLRNLAG